MLYVMPSRPSAMNKDSYKTAGQEVGTFVIQPFVSTLWVNGMSHANGMTTTVMPRCKIPLKFLPNWLGTT